MANAQEAAAGLTVEGVMEMMMNVRIIAAEKEPAKDGNDGGSSYCVVEWSLGAYHFRLLFPKNGPPNINF